MPHVIEEPSSFTELLENLRNELLVAVDTEAASFHRHRDRVYLLQLSSRAETWLVDPLAVAGLPGFGELLADPGIEFVFHDADYDLRLLGHEFGFRAARLFDTRVAAQFLNESGIGLAALLDKHFGVRLDKQFQRADWSLRPLSPAMLAYAATDTRHLPALRDLLHQQLLEQGRLSWVEEECELLTQVRWPEPDPPELDALAVKGARTLSARALAIFRELYVWRTRLAEALDRAAFRIVGNEALFALAQQPPARLAELTKVRGLGRELVERRGEEILAAVRRGLGVPEAELPKFTRVPHHRPDPAFAARLDRLKAARSNLATRYQLAPGILAPNWLLEAIARALPRSMEQLAQVEGLRRWQLHEFGGELLLAI
ncbi:MAG TPA: HRDC domain-containing protein [Gemmatimonadales bacterium]|nr:HRDC domain-containing protein [Gemmatimonadales bacterium]